MIYLLLNSAVVGWWWLVVFFDFETKKVPRDGKLQKEFFSMFKVILSGKKILL